MWGVAERDGTLDVDLERLRPTFERVARLACALFAADAEVVIAGRSEVWRSADLGSGIAAGDPASALVIQQDRAIWIPDVAKSDPVGADPFGGDGTAPVFFAGAPIRRNADGPTIGALNVSSRASRPYDAELAGRLADLAAMVGVEIDRACAVADHTRILETVQRSEQRLTLAAEIAGLLVYEIDYVEHNLLVIGDTTEFYGRGLTYEDLRRDPAIGIHPEDRSRAIAEWAESVALGARCHNSYRAHRADGEKVWIGACAELIRDADGRPRRMIGILQNITPQKEAEAAVVVAKNMAEAASEAKTQFLATMSHEIRTPLNGVLGIAQAMAEDVLTPQQRERLDLMRQAGQSLLGILNDGLDIAKIEAGELQLEAVPFDFGGLARSSGAMFGAVAKQKGLELIVDPAGAEGTYLGDPTRLRQIIQNLVSNALKFTEAGKVRLSAAWHEAQLEIEVSDTGIGIPSDRLSQIFGKFVQADVSTNRRYGGTGLGLAICKDLIDAMGGKIHVESVVDGGTSFRVYLPLPRVGDAAAPSAPTLNTPDATETYADLRVLAAEDNPVNQIVLRALLAQIGIEPTIVADGEAALAAWRAQHWDLILMDVQMPKLNGFQATRIIRAEEASRGFSETPILALTANAMPQDVADYLACGMNGHVSKPIDAGVLFRAIETVLAGATADEAAAA